MLLGLRSGQLLGVAPLLFDWEFIQFGSLALEVESGTRRLSEIWQRPEAWTYMEHAQGTMLPIAGTALLVPLFGANVWGLHATSVLPEALALVLLLTLVWRRSDSVLLVLSAAFAWSFVPRSAAVWQMLPFGNHTEFLWIPLAVALLLDLRIRSWLGSSGVALALALLLGLGFVAYRGTLATAAALVLVLVATQGLAGLRRAIAVVFAAGCLALLALYSLTEPEQWRGLQTLRDLLLGAPVMDPDPWPERLRRLPERLPSAPAILGGPWLYLGLVGTATAAALFQWSSGRAAPPPDRGIAAAEESGTRSPAILLLLLWAAISLGMTLVADARYDQYFLQPFYALLSVVLLLPTMAVPRSLLRRCSLGCVLLIGLLGLPDGAELLRPSAWQVNQDYQGLKLWGQFQMTSLDEDDIPYWDKLAGSPDLVHYVGQGFPPTERCVGNLRAGGKHPIPAAGTSRCSCWGEGELTSHLAQRLREAPKVPLEQLGMGAWIGCNRDKEALESAMKGLAPPLKARMLNGVERLQ